MAKGGAKLWWLIRKGRLVWQSGYMRMSAGEPVFAAIVATARHTQIHSRKQDVPRKPASGSIITI